MKFVTTQVKPVKAFDVAAAEEALAESFERLAVAQEALLATEGQCANCMSVIEDCSTAIEAFNKFGDKSLGAVLAICNGGTGALDQALGLESLAIDTIKAMDAAEVKVTKDRYVSALEANVGEAMKVFVEKCKEWLARFIEWVKELFVGNAKLIKLVQEARFGNLDPEAPLTGLSLATAQELSKLITQRLNETADKEAINTLLAKRETGTVKSLGWDAASAAKMATQFMKYAPNRDAIKGLNDMVNKEIQDILLGNLDDNEKKQNINKVMAEAKSKREGLMAEAKAIRALGVQLLRMAKKTVKANAEQKQPTQG